MSKPILITGATGKQGGAVLRALLAHPSYSPTTHPIYAVTRNPSSSGSTRLSALSSSISLIAGDLNNISAIFASLPAKPWGVFSVQLPGKTEVPQGKALIDGAVQAGVSHFVYTSVDRAGGDDPTDVPHFKTKHEIEQYLIQKSAESNGKMNYTILRPVLFLDNLEWGFIGKIVATAWRDAVGPRKLQVIATTDIGVVGAKAFLENDNPTYKNKGISLAGDELTFEEANRIFLEKTGQEIPVTFGFLASFVLWVSEEMGRMFKFFVEKGFGADIAAVRKLNEGLQDFPTWVERSSYGKGKK
jgi:uncharacterized protein YbjT (DUF2867 family)